MKKTHIGLAGEFYTLAKLTHLELVATLTLSNTKDVDILVTKQELNSLFKLEVKTTDQSPRHEKLFGDEKFYMWTMAKKHEDIIDEKLIYCFVVLRSLSELPKFFLVPSEDVANYVKWQHDFWLSTRKRKVKSTTMRTFRIAVSDPKNYENNWKILGINKD